MLCFVVVGLVGKCKIDRDARDLRTEAPSAKRVHGGRSEGVDHSQLTHGDE